MTSYLRGIFNFLDRVSPSFINLKNPKYIEIDNTYFSGLLIVNYLRENSELIFKNLIDNNENIILSIFYEKQDTIKVIKDLTFNIGNTSVNISDNSKSRQDSEIALFTHNDAKFIRKELQINNEKLYFIYAYILVYSKDKKELEYKLDKIKGLANINGLITKRSYFRQSEIFKSCMPLGDNQELIKESSRRNILTSGISITYPFLSSSITDENGIFFGTNLNDNSMVFIDKFETKKYKNANICIFGTSGAGKSYFTKLMILRNALLGHKQFIIDPDREYTELIKNLNGSIIKIGLKSKTYINIFDIREESLEEGESGFLVNKINKIIGFLNLIIPNMNEDDKSYFEKKIIEVYNKKKINFEDSSLYKEDGKFKSKKDMPRMQDLYEIIDENYKLKLFPFVHGSLKYFNNYTNIEVDNNIILGDVYDLGEENLQYGMFIFTDFFWDKIKKDRKENKTIYFDEIWRLIGITSNKNVASFIYKIFKTIRKYGGSSVAITQDITDVFSLDDGSFGKSIINNSEFKIFFNLEEENIKEIFESINISNEEQIKIKGLKRGECLMLIGKEHILVKIDSSDFEKELTEREINFDEL